MSRNASVKQPLVNHPVVFLAISSVVQTALLIGQHTKSKSQDKLSVESTPGISLVKQPRPSNLQRAKGSYRTRSQAVLKAMTRGKNLIPCPFRINSLMRHAFTFGSPDRWIFLDSNLNFTPAIDIEETENAYLVKSDLPGLEKS